MVDGYLLHGVAWITLILHATYSPTYSPIGPKTNLEPEVQKFVTYHDNA